MKTIYYILFVLVGVLSACTEYDNYEAPKSKLTGKVHYQGTPVGIRNNGAGFELWQDGYELRESIPLHLAQDGSYSALLFDGEYKLVRKAGGPWVDQTNDTILVRVNGNTKLDVEVSPYFIVRDESYRIDLSNKTITGTFIIDRIDPNANLSNVRMYIGPGAILDNNFRGSYKKAEVSEVVFGQALSITMDITDDLIKRTYLHARVGVKASESGEYAYSQVQRLELK